jgi:hypothetical protein
LCQGTTSQPAEKLSSVPCSGSAALQRRVQAFVSRPEPASAGGTKPFFDLFHSLFSRRHHALLSTFFSSFLTNQQSIDATSTEHYDRAKRRNDYRSLQTGTLFWHC